MTRFFCGLLIPAPLETLEHCCGLIVIEIDWQFKENFYYFAHCTLRLLPLW